MGYVCQQLGIKMIRFAIPDHISPSRQFQPQGVDGDLCRWLIRQKVWRHRQSPYPLRNEMGVLVRYTQHKNEPVPKSHNVARAIRQEVSVSYPYGVSDERVEGRQIIHNPTAPGRGHLAARL